MKRKLSLILALVMMIGVFSPIANAGQAVSDGEELFNALKGKVNAVGIDKVEGLLGVYTVIKDNAGEIANALYDEHKTYFENRDITNSEIEGLMNNDLYKNIIHLAVDMKMNSNLPYDTVREEIEGMMIDFYNSLPQTTRDSIDHYAVDKDEKIAVIANVATYVLDVKIGTANNDGTNLVLKLNDAQRKAINNKITKNEDSENPIQTEEMNIINELSAKATGFLSSDQIKSLSLLLSQLKMVDLAPSTGNSTGSPGTSTSTPTTPAKKDEPKKEEPKVEKVVATLDKKDVKTTVSETGTTSVKVDDTKAVAAVKEARKDAGAKAEVSLEINLDTVNNLKVEVELSAKLIKELSDSNVNLIVKTKKGNIEIPAETLKDIKLPAGASLEFKMDEVENSVAQEKMPENKNAMKVLDLYLSITKDGKSEKVENFKKPIVIKLDVKEYGDPDKLAVYYLNEEDDTLTFVAGKVKDGNITLSLNHFSKYVVVESDITFEDVEGHWGQKNIESMAAKEILGGYDDGSFRPDDKVTRAEFSKMIVSAMELEIEDYKGEFADVNTDAWYAGYIATMLKNKIAEGYEDSTFRPDDKITRAEMGVILGNVLDVELTQAEKTNILNKFNDNTEIKAWAQEGIAKAAEAGIMVGDNGQFNPNNNTTRAEVATAVYRLYNR